MSRHHVIISGTGRSGTTLLVHLLTVLGLDTGFDGNLSSIDANSNAGLELDIRGENAPYIVKGPYLCHCLGEAIREDQIVVDHAIIPIRDLFAAAESRRRVERKARGMALRQFWAKRSWALPLTLFRYLRHPGLVHGGLTESMAPKEQETVLARMLGNLLHVAAEYDIPVTLLHFPRLVNDPAYLYRKLDFLLPSITYDVFLQRFNEVVKPELVHNFGANSDARFCGAARALEQGSHAR